MYKCACMCIYILIIFYHPYKHISILIIYHPILATICTLCEAPESNNIDSGAKQINCIIIIIMSINILSHIRGLGSFSFF